MPLPSQVVQVPFVGGMDTQTDPKHVKPGKLLRLENGEFDKTGTINKRNGFDETYNQVSTDGDGIEEGGSILTKDSELIINARQTLAATGRTGAGDGWRMYSLDAVSEDWADIGSCEPISHSVDTITRPEKYWIMPDLAYVNGYTCFVGVEDTLTPVFGNGQVRISIRSDETKSIIVENYSLGANNSRSPHVVGLPADLIDADNIFHVWAILPATNTINLSIVDTAGLSALPVGMTMKRNDLHADALFDVTIAEDPVFGWCSVIAYKATDTHVWLYWYDKTGTQRHAVDLGASAIPVNAISVQRIYQDALTAYRICCTWQDNGTGNLLYSLRNEDSTQYQVIRTLTAACAAEEVTQITCMHDESWNAPAPAANTICWYYEIDNGGDFSQFIRRAWDYFLATAPTDLSSILNACLVSKAFEHDGKSYVWINYESDLQSTAFLTCSRTTLDMRYDCRALDARAEGIRAHHGLSQVIEATTGIFEYAAGRRDRLLDDGDVLKSIVGSSVTFGNLAMDNLSIGPTTSVATGGYIGDTDGRFAELGFHLYPEPIATSAQNPGGNQPDGTYYHRVHYEWTDLEGQIHRSAPCPAVSTVLSAGTGTQYVRLVIPCLHKGEIDKLTETKIAVYRLCTDGVYHRCVEGFATNDNNLATATITFNDTATDAALLDNEILYTEGGVLENIIAPATRISVGRQNRVFLVPEEDRELIWYSKEKMPGVGIEFTDTFTKRISAGGPINALGELDEKVIVFKENEIHAFSGVGPNALGTGSVFTESYQISTDVGCIDRSSVIKCDAGLLFKSNKGIQLLGRGLAVQHIGAEVKDWDAYQVIDAKLVSAKNQVRYLMSNGDMLVYDYRVGQWAVFTNSTWDVGFFADSVMFQDTYCFLDTAGVVHRETAAYSDDTVYIPLQIDTAWYHLADLQGYQRCRWVAFLGDFATDHVLSVDVFYDYVETISETRSITANAAFGLDAPYQIRFKPKQQKSQAMRFRLSDAVAPGWVGGLEGYSLSGMALDIGAKKGIAKLSKAKTI